MNENALNTNALRLVKEYRKRIMEVYDPKKAFGNTEILKLLDESEERVRRAISNEICLTCDGEGSVMCGDCEGRGFNEKQK